MCVSTRFPKFESLDQTAQAAQTSRGTLAVGERIASVPRPRPTSDERVSPQWIHVFYIHNYNLILLRASSSPRLII